jgi:hypothetical protein
MTDTCNVKVNDRQFPSSAASAKAGDQLSNAANAIPAAEPPVSNAINANTAAAINACVIARRTPWCSTSSTITAPLKIPASGRNRMYVAASPRIAFCGRLISHAASGCMTDAPDVF